MKTSEPNARFRRLRQLPKRVAHTNYDLLDFNLNFAFRYFRVRLTKLKKFLFVKQIISHLISSRHKFKGSTAESNGNCFCFGAIKLIMSIHTERLGVARFVAITSNVINFNKYNSLINRSGNKASNCWLYSEIDVLPQMTCDKALNRCFQSTIGVERKASQHPWT